MQLARRQVVTPAIRSVGRPLQRVVAALVMVVVAAAASAGLGARASAQGTRPADADVTSRESPASRAALTAALAAATQRNDVETSTAIRRRLTEGDVGPGDRLVVTLTLDTVARYEFVVRDSQRVDVLPLGSFVLRGVLRSELPAAFRRFYAQYYKNPDVRVQSLIRIGFLGAVQRPGYYNVPPDAPITEAFSSSAGGPATNANLKKIEVRRADQRLLDQRGYARAARDGLTFDEVGIRSGDEVQVPEQRRASKYQILRTVVVALSLVTSVLFLIRSAYNN